MSLKNSKKEDKFKLWGIKNRNPLTSLNQVQVRTSDGGLRVHIWVEDDRLKIKTLDLTGRHDYMTEILLPWAAGTM